MQYDNIKKFNFIDIDNYKNSLVLGNKYYDRINLVEKLIDVKNKKYSGIEIIILSDSEETLTFYKKKYPESYIYYKNDKNITDFIKLFIYRISTQRYQKKLKHSLIVMDFSQILIDDTFRKILLENRYYLTQLIISTSFIKETKSNLITNFHFIFLLSDNCLIKQTKNYEYYGSIFPSINLFIKFFTEITKKFGCMVIKSQGNYFNDVFYFNIKTI
jgi:hypothetical protein